MRLINNRPIVELIEVVSDFRIEFQNLRRSESPQMQEVHLDCRLNYDIKQNKTQLVTLLIM